MVYHLRKLQRANPCSEISGFTRLLSSPNGALDALADEIPTVTAKALAYGNGCRETGENSCDMGFPVMNRPHAVTQLLANLPPSITEEYVMIAETDHIFMSEPPNRATPSKPACFPFGYMDAKAATLRPIVNRFVDDPDIVDPCGPSPVIIHLPLLRRLTPTWLQLSFQLKRDAEAERVFGWVLEMWGYTLAATQLGIRHLVWQSLQTEPSALWHASLDGNPHIYHYTFGLEFTSDGLPVTTVGDWSLDKRHYMSGYPPRPLEPPPRCAGKAAATLTSLFNEAMTNISDWPEAAHGTKGTKGWGDGGTGGGVMSGVGARQRGAASQLTDATYRRSALAQAAATRGPWKWAGKSPVLFYRGGRIYTPWGSGRWSIAGEAIAVSLGPCGQYRLTFNKAMTAFAASTARGLPPSSHGVLMSPDGDGEAAADSPESENKDDDDEEGGAGVEAAAAAARWRRMSSEPIYRRLLGSGPWSWTGVAPVAFLGGGVLSTPWGYGTWAPHSQPSTIMANFVGEKHKVTFDDCWAFQSVRERDGDLASGVARIESPPTSCPELTTGGRQ